MIYALLQSTPFRFGLQLGPHSQASPPHPSSYPLPSSSPSPSPPSYPSAYLPGKTSPSCSHHIYGARDSSLPSVTRHRSRMGRVSMYCATVLCRLEMYVSISSSQAALIASPKGGYSHVPSACRCGNFPESRPATLWWNPPTRRLLQGVTTPVSDPNSRMAWTTVM